MPRKGNSYYVDSNGPNEAAYVAGIRWLISRAKATGEEGLVAVSQLQNLRNLSRSSAGPFFDALEKQRELTVEGVTIRLLTLRKDEYYQWNGPVLIMFGTSKLWDKVDALDGNAEALLIPWMREGAQAWIDTWDAKEVGEDGQPVGAVKPKPEAVAKSLWQIAIDRLTLLVNINTGIVHPSDREHAIKTFETLYHKGQLPDSETLRQYLVRSGWRPNDAREVGELSSMISSGRRPKGSQGAADEYLWSFLQNEQSKQNNS